MADTDGKVAEAFGVPMMMGGMIPLASRQSFIVKDGKIVLNISYSATQVLKLGNDCVTFEARFGGVSFAVQVPVRAVLGIYARETGQGMIFPEGDADPDPGGGPPAATPSDGTPTPTPRKRPKLQVVK